MPKGTSEFAFRRPAGLCLQCVQGQPDHCHYQQVTRSDRLQLLPPPTRRSLQYQRAPPTLRSDTQPGFAFNAYKVSQTFATTNRLQVQRDLDYYRHLQPGLKFQYQKALPTSVKMKVKMLVKLKVKTRTRSHFRSSACHKLSQPLSYTS